jgi:hypothetical protein
MEGGAKCLSIGSKGRFVITVITFELSCHNIICKDIIKCQSYMKYKS